MAQITPSFEEPKLLIDGELVESSSGERFETINPATGEQLTTIPRGTEQDIDRAVSAASAAQEEWYWEMTPKERGEALFEFAELLRENGDRLGAIDAADSGNPYG